MARQPRLVVAQWPVHIVQRGSNRMACFNDDADYLVYIALLRKAIVAAQCSLHAYCLMRNHIHLLVTPSDADGCSKLMKAVAQRYSYYFNAKYERTGPLWEGRFRSCIVLSRAYVLACYRYIELNPVRAGLVNHPAAYLWSSYAINSGVRHDPLVLRHAELAAIGSAAYVGLFRDAVHVGVISNIRQATETGRPLNGEPIRKKPGRKPKSVSDTDLDLFSGGAAS